MDAWKALEADTHRQYGRYSRKLLLQGALTRRTFRVIVTLRLCQASAQAGGLLRAALPVFKLLHHLAAHRATVDLPWQTEIEGGVALTHAWGLVVNGSARIGRNVTLFHGVTLGRRDRLTAEGVRVTESPVIEDEVWLGPHAIVVGGVTIGRGSRILGGAFVTESIPPHSVVSGNPAAIVKSGCKPDVFNPVPF